MLAQNKHTATSTSTPTLLEGETVTDSLRLFTVFLWHDASMSATIFDGRRLAISGSGQHKTSTNAQKQTLLRCPREAAAASYCSASPLATLCRLSNADYAIELLSTTLASKRSLPRSTSGIEVHNRRFISEGST